MGARSRDEAARRPLLRWGGWFFLINSGILAVIGLRYLTHFPWPAQGLAQFYAVSAFIGHFAALGFLPWLLVVVPLSLVVPKRAPVVTVAVVLAAAVLTLTLVDSLVFTANRFHLSRLTMSILGWKTWGFAIVYFVVLLGFCSMVATWSWPRFSAPPRRRVGWWVASVLVALLVASHGLHIWAAAHYYVPITSFGEYLPLFRPASARSFLVERGIVDLAETRESRLLETLGSRDHANLSYPLSPMRCDPPENPLNVVLILVDAMRADSVDDEIAPNITAFADRAIRFTEHYSGGNSTRTGTFSMFYGLPATYWKSFESVQRSPVLIDLFQDHGYEPGIFSSGPLHHPASLDRTAFSRIPNLRMETEGDRPPERDVNLARDWLEWLDRRDPDQPFFGFLFFDAPPKFHPPDYEPMFTAPRGASEAQEAFARYKTAVHFNDRLVGRVLEDLERRGLMDDTVVIVTSDHGEEFDENGLGFTRHGSGYSRHQLMTPMLVWWPGRESVSVERRTSHSDIPPTLITEVLGCVNPPEDYGSGTSLFSGGSWEWIIAGSYHDIAIVEPDRVTISHPSGNFEIRGPDYRILEGARLHKDVVERAIAETTRFYAD